MNNGTVWILFLTCISIVEGRGGMGGGGRGGGGFGGGRGSGIGGGGRGGGGKGGGGMGGGRAVAFSSLGMKGGGSGYIIVSSYRGGGYSSKRDSETINSSMIYSAIFKNISFLLHSRLENKMWISRPDSPITIKGDLVYFWDEQYLPSPTTTTCSNFITSNDYKNIEFCNVKEMERCNRRMDKITELQTYSFFTPNYSRLSSFSWICPKGQVCCEWECCDLYHKIEESKTDPFFIIFLTMLIIMAVFTIITVSENPRSAAKPERNLNEKGSLL